MKKTYNLSREALKNKRIKSATIKISGTIPESRRADKIAAVLHDMIL